MKNWTQAQSKQIKYCEKYIYVYFIYFLSQYHIQYCQISIKFYYELAKLHLLFAIFKPTDWRITLTPRWFLTVVLLAGIQYTYKDQFSSDMSGPASKTFPIDIRFHMNFWKWFYGFTKHFIFTLYIITLYTIG